MGTSEHIEKFICAVRGIIDGSVYHAENGKKLEIAFDEWNVMYHAHPLSTVRTLHIGRRTGCWNVP